MPVDTTHAEYDSNIDDWTLIRDVLAGERAVKEKGPEYLPSLEDQSMDEYSAYKDRAVFYGATGRTLNGLVGVVFRRPMQVELGAAEGLRPSLDTISSDGAPFNVFAKRVIREVIGFGRHGALLDRPATGGTPYLVGYTAECLTNWRTRIVNGKSETDQVVLFETVSVPAEDGIGSEAVEQFRVLGFMGGGYAQQVYAKNEDGKWVPAGDPVQPTVGQKPLDYIPFQFFGPLYGEPEVERSPILDIAQLNIHHYRSYADLQHGRHYTAMPTYYAVSPPEVDTGAEEVYKVGPNRVWLVPPGESPGILEFHGQGLLFLENAVADLERQMSVLGARLLQAPRKSAAEAAEVVQMRQRGEHATLLEIVESVERGLTALLKRWVEWQGVDSSGVKVTLNRDFIESPLANRDVIAIIRLYQAKMIPLDVAVRAVVEGDVLPSTVTLEEVKQLLNDPSQVYVDEKLNVAKMVAEAKVDAIENPDPMFGGG